VEVVVMAYFKSLRVAAALLILAVGAGSAWAQQQPAGSWSSTPLSGNGSIVGDTYYYGGSASDGTYLYVVGGYHYGAGYTSGPMYYARLRRFDPVNNTWTNMSQIPNGGSYYGGGTCFYTDGVNSYIYIFANYDPWYGYTGYTYRWTLSSNSWTQLSNIPNNNYYSGAAALGNRIYIAGGGNNQTAFYEFNPADNSFTSRPSMPTGRYLLTATSIPSLNRFYAIGGYGNVGYMPTVEAYEPPSATYPNGRWLSGTAGNDPLEHDPQDMNTPNADGTPGPAAPRYMAKSVTVGTRVYVVGGYSNNGYMNTMLELNPNTNQASPGGNQWRQRANMAGTRGYYPAAGVINASAGPRVVAYGGLSNSTTGEIFTPPDFGSAPNVPTALGQIGSRAETALQALADQTQFDGWTNNQVQFTANITDPDANQQVRFRVQVKPQSAAWTSNQVSSLQTNLGAQGVHTLTYNIPNDGGYDWRWRVEDAFSNSVPAAAGTWVEAFGDPSTPNTNSPDFRSDQAPPSDPIATSPHETDIEVDDPVIGDVILNWIESTDNAPAAGISYELQVATDGGFNGIEAQIFSTAGQSSYPVALTVSRYNKFWRIRARDVGGNFSNWSAPLTFRVTFNDGIDHSAGDAKKACGFSAASSPVLVVALLGALILSFGLLRRNLA
jgi:hypothetical protein